MPHCENHLRLSQSLTRPEGRTQKALLQYLSDTYTGGTLVEEQGAHMQLTPANFRPRKMIKAVQFNGSSTHMNQILDWMATGVFRPTAVYTRDITMMHIDTEEGYRRVFPGMWVVQMDGEEWYVLQDQVFTSLYESM